MVFGADSCAVESRTPTLFFLVFGVLFVAEFFNGGTDIGFSGERLVLDRFVGREIGDGDVH